jgi:hypothetical protein
MVNSDHPFTIVLALFQKVYHNSPKTTERYCSDLQMLFPVWLGGISLGQVRSSNARWVHGEKAKMLWKVFVIILALWLLGFGLQIGGSLIHVLLVAAFVVLIWHVIVVRRRFA